MALYHHSATDYNIAASQAATKARDILERQFEAGRANALRVIEQIERDIPTDRIVRGRALKFVPVADGIEVGIGDTQERVHQHALDQLADRAAFPRTYAHELLANTNEWARDLLAHNLRTLYQQGSDGRYLTRSVGGEMRGFLSDKYRRLDSRPLLESFVKSFTEMGAVPSNGYALETKVGVRCLLPMVFEPVEHEVMAFGLHWGNSDFGDGTHLLRLVMFRLWCTNEAIMQDSLRQIHLGKRLSEDFTYSDKTYQLDTSASASAVKDMVEHLLSPAHINESVALVKRASEHEVKPGAISAWLKKHLTKSEAKVAEDSFNSADVINLPPGNTSWRLSNTISLLARDTKNENRKLDLQRLAGKAVEVATA